jgi:hypothetical protein
MLLAGASHPVRAWSMDWFVHSCGNLAAGPAASFHCWDNAATLAYCSPASPLIDPQ